MKPDGLPLHIDWRIHTVGPGRACLVCLDALRRGDIALDREGALDDPDYIQGLSEEDRARFSRRNVLPFSLSVAAHEVLQLVGLLAVEPLGSQSTSATPTMARAAAFASSSEPSICVPSAPSSLRQCETWVSTRSSSS